MTDTNGPAPVITHCPFCGTPWPVEVDDKFRCNNCATLFRVEAPDGTHPKAPLPKPGVILEVPPGSVPDSPKKSGIKKTPEVSGR